ncbi:MAG: SIS domain-containing protein, partial [Phenylobacterium sp.]
MSAAAIETGRRVLRQAAGALEQQAAALGPDFARAVDLLAAARGRIICTGIGKSGHVARKIAATFASTGAPASFVHANEASHGDLGMISRDDVILALSKSGENRELAAGRDGAEVSGGAGAPLEEGHCEGVAEGEVWGGG